MTTKNEQTKKKTKEKQNKSVKFEADGSGRAGTKEQLGLGFVLYASAGCGTINTWVYVCTSILVIPVQGPYFELRSN